MVLHPPHEGILTQICPILEPCLGHPALAPEVVVSPVGCPECRSNCGEYLPELSDRQGFLKLFKRKRCCLCIICFPLLGTSICWCGSSAAAVAVGQMQGPPGTPRLGRPVWQALPSHGSSNKCCECNTHRSPTGGRVEKECKLWICWVT